MRITLDRTLIDTLRRMSDEQLWTLFSSISSGICSQINKKSPDLRRINGFRALLDEVTDGDLQRINELLERYTQGKQQRKD